MPSIRGWLNQNQPLTEVLISGLFDGDSDLASHQFIALIDTGSTKTCITRTVVETLGLEPFTRILVATPSGLERRKAYTFTIGFVSHVDDVIGTTRGAYFFPEPVSGADFVKNSNFDVLIGMDILSKGRLLFEHQQFEFSFGN